MDQSSIMLVWKSGSCCVTSWIPFWMNEGSHINLLYLSTQKSCLVKCWLGFGFRTCEVTHTASRYVSQQVHRFFCIWYSWIWIWPLSPHVNVSYPVFSPSICIFFIVHSCMYLYHLVTPCSGMFTAFLLCIYLVQPMLWYLYSVPLVYSPSSSQSCLYLSVMVVPCCFHSASRGSPRNWPVIRVNIRAPLESLIFSISLT